MNDTTINTHYCVGAYDNCVCEDDYNDGTHEYSKGFEDNEYNKALKEYKRVEPLFENASLTKQTYIIEVIKEKKTEHVCTFEETDYALYCIDEIGRYVQPELKCKCGAKKYGEKEYI